AARQSALAARLPDLFAGPAMGPLRRHVLVTRGGPLRRPELDEILDRKAVPAQDADPASERQVELDLAGIRPLEAVHSAVVTHQALPRRLPRPGHAELKQGAAGEKDQAPSRSEQARGFRDPPVRITPEGSAVLGKDQIEACIWKRRRFRARMDQRKLEAELLLKLAGAFQLPGGIVQPDRPRPAARQPRRPVGSAAAELQHVLPGDLRHGLELALGNAPDPPIGLASRPRAAPGLEVIHAPGIPEGAVATRVIREQLLGRTA